MTIPAPGQYGEPWKCIAETYDGLLIYGANGCERNASEDDLLRVFACVNALDGRDPEKLAELEAAIRRAWVARKQQPALPTPISLDVIFSAARAFGTVKE